MGLIKADTGTLAPGHVNALQNSTLDLTGTGGVTFTVAGSQTCKLGGVKGNVLLNAGTNSLKRGANNESTASTGGSTAAVANANIRFGTVSQRLASLTSGAGATVTFTSGVASLTGGGDGGKDPGVSGGAPGTAAVPEPGTFGLPLVGTLGLLASRRKKTGSGVAGAGPKECRLRHRERSVDSPLVLRAISIR